MTPHTRFGSRFVMGFLPVISLGCGQRSEARPIAEPPHDQGEVCLGVADHGIFSDLDARVQLALPSPLAPDRVTARVDRKHGVLVLSIDGFPRKAYPLTGDAPLAVGAVALALRAGDRDELRPLLAEAHVTEGPAAHDRDGDGI